MSRISLTIVTLLASLCLSGCSKSGDPSAATSSGQTGISANGTKTKISISPDAKPDVVVSTFLDATRAGNEVAATELLTSKVREETAKEGLTLDPPGTPSMKYRIAKVEYLEDNKDAAYVNSIWTESSANGKEDSFEVVWVLRRQSDGWRIAGMAAQNVPEEPPIFLNFEDPEDVQRIKSQVNTNEGAPMGTSPMGTAAAQAPPGAVGQPPLNGVGQPQVNGVGQVPPNGFGQAPANGFGQPSNNGAGQPAFNPQGQPPLDNPQGQPPINSAQNFTPSSSLK